MSLGIGVCWAPTCGKTFDPTHLGHLCCSPACARAFRRHVLRTTADRLETVNANPDDLPTHGHCLTCGRFNKATGCPKGCDPAPARAAHCGNCGTPIKATTGKHRFCDRNCRAKFARLTAKKRPPVRACEWCRRGFYPARSDQKYCERQCRQTAWGRQPA